MNDSIVQLFIVAIWCLTLALVSHHVGYKNGYEDGIKMQCQAWGSTNSAGMRHGFLQSHVIEGAKWTSGGEQ